MHAHRRPVLREFADAFRARDEPRLRSLLAPDATAEVLGSGFGEETGPDDIAAKSLAHLLGDGEAPLEPEVFEAEGGPVLLFLADGALDCAARVVVDGDRIRRLEYFVAGFRAGDLERIAAARGVPVATGD